MRAAGLRLGVNRAALASVTPSKSTRQPDLVEWARKNRSEIKQIKDLRKKEDLGIVGWAKYLQGSISESRTERAKKKKEEKEEKALVAKAEKGDDQAKKQLEELKSKRLSEAEKDPNYVDPSTQYYSSLALLKKMKWKRVTWDKNADYEGFAQRIENNDNVFGSIPAYSYLCMHVVEDARNPRLPVGDTSLAYQRGSLTNWLFEERDAKSVEPHVVYPKSSPKRKDAIPAYSVDWTAGEAKLADTISPQEMGEFLTSVAPRLQEVQRRMDDEQAKLTEEIEETRVRLGAHAIKYNKYDRTFWDDPERHKDDLYINPGEMQMFIAAAKRQSTLMRWYLTQGHQVRLVKPGQPFSYDIEKREISIPCDFEKYNYLSLHSKWEKFERVFNFCRSIWFVWFAMCMMLVGDLEAF